MKALCKKNYLVFKEGENYEVFSINSIFEKDDFISIASSKDHTKPTPVYRFRMNKSLEYIEDYIGENENYFYNYFYSPEETQNLTRAKLIERMLK